jgi:uncharacterized protein
MRFNLLVSAVRPPGEDTDVPAFCRALGVPGLADVHVHFLPPRLLRRVWEYFDAAGPLVGTAWPIRYRWPDEQRVAHLRALGVLAYSALAYAHRPGMAADLNAWTLEFARATPGCLPSATFYPEPGVVDYVQAALDAGARVFKVHLQVGGFPADEPRLRPVWGLLAEAGVPVVVHAGHAPVATAHTGPAPFAALLAHYPTLTAIVAHLGAPDYEPFLELAETASGWRWIRPWRSRRFSSGSPRSRPGHCPACGRSAWPGRCSWAATSRTSPTPTPSRSPAWCGWGSAIRGCARSAGRTRRACSGSRSPAYRRF